MNKARLERLYDLMAELSNTEKQFNMDYFFSKDGKSLGGRERIVDRQPLDDIIAAINRTNTLSCDMAACMGGWACTVPEFREAGLLAKPEGPTTRGEYYLNIAYGRRIGFHALEVFFDISRAQACFLFDANGYSVDNDHRSKWDFAAAADHLRRFIDAEGDLEKIGLTEEEIEN